MHDTYQAKMPDDSFDEPDDCEREKDEPLWPALSATQRQRVQENIGLVGVHLRNHGRRLGVSRGTDLWGDLFQEGCLSLTRAAITYGMNNPVPFASYALRRIHMGVSRWLQKYRITLNSSGIDVLAAANSPDALNGQQNESDDEDRERGTIGARLREKYERGLRRAADAVLTRGRERADRQELVRRIIDERLLVPDEDCKTGLRQIARQTKSSFERVQQCERQIATAIRAGLQADPEFHVLRSRARTEPAGVRAVIDARLEASLAASSARELTHRLRTRSRAVRGEMLDHLWNARPKVIEQVMAREIAMLNWKDRESVLRAGAA